jgi:hypothetical protein
MVNGKGGIAGLQSLSGQPSKSMTAAAAWSDLRIDGTDGLRFDPGRAGPPG